ncbi:MAG: protein translocase subunit SecF [Alphaproteobacteria bacterium]
MAIIPLKLISPGTRIDFIGKRVYAFAFSIFLLVASLGFYATNGLNYGIDFAGGIAIEVTTKTPANLDEMRSQLNGLGLGEVSLQDFGSPTDLLIRVPSQPGDEDAQLAAVEKVKASLNEIVASYRRVEFVGPKVGGELVRAGIIAVTLSLLGIMIYVWFRFEWQFGVAAILATAHDVITTVGLFAILGHEFNLTTLAAVLTIAGYSINDTVVVFDRIRENLRKYKTMPIAELMNRSVNDTLSRTILTGTTTLMALTAIYFFGGAVLSDFALALIWGILIGTFSSIYVAAPLVMMMNVRATLSKRDNAESEPAKKAKP